MDDKLLKLKFWSTRKVRHPYVGIISSYNLMNQSSADWSEIIYLCASVSNSKWCDIIRKWITDWCLNPFCFPYNLFSFPSCFEYLGRIPFSAVMLSFLVQQRCFAIMVDMLSLLIIVLGWSMTWWCTRFTLHWLHLDRKKVLFIWVKHSYW